jgi:hypothetical protein
MAKHSKRFGRKQVLVLHLFCVRVPALPSPHAHTRACKLN